MIEEDTAPLADDHPLVRQWHACLLSDGHRVGSVADGGLITAAADVGLTAEPNGGRSWEAMWK